MQQQQDAKPHIVVIMADQLRWDAIGPHTPNINKLRDESVSFERAYCASPLCVPARGAFFTGCYPNETGSLINPWTKQEAQHGSVRQSLPNMYQWMENEWDSWHTGKQHLFAVPKPEEDPDSRTHWRQLEGRYEAYMKANGRRKPGGPAYKGMVPETAYGAVTRTKTYSLPTTGCYEEGFECFYDGFILNDTIRAIRERDVSRPLLLNAMFLAPHPPLEVPEPWYSRVKEAELPENVGRWSPNQSPLQLYNLTGALGSRYSRDDWQHIWPVYLGLVSLLDDCVGRIVEELKEQRLYDDALIVFTSDHGEMLGSHGLWQKMCMYEESVQTPLMFKLPQGSKVSVSAVVSPVSSIDVWPTICEAAGIEPPPGISGKSLMPLMEGRSSSVRDDIYIQYDGNGARGNFQRCIVRGEHKLIVDMFKDETFLELYDLKSDPQEHVNLAFEADDERVCRLIDDLLASLRSHMKSTGDLLSLSEDVHAAFINSYKPFQR
jgi:arylsulfatase A-like enzyme